MLTLVAMPKPFIGHFKMIQYNAIQSWKKLPQNPEIILFGDEEGTAEAAQNLGVRHIGQVEENEYGTPLLDSVMMSAQQNANHEFICYVNADIILPDKLCQALTICAQKFSQFLLVGRRCDVDITESLNFDNADWQASLIEEARINGELKGADWIDYFVFPRGLFQSVPPLAIGRTAWDGWMLGYARAQGAPLIDASSLFHCIHQNHDYSHVQGGYKAMLDGDELKQNVILAGGYAKLSTLREVSYFVTSKGLKYNFSPYRFLRPFYMSPFIHTLLSPVVRLFKKEKAY